jgi:NAD(P)H-dependent FMN reductase
MTTPKIGLILASTRQNRFGEKPATWILDLAAKRADMQVELMDLRDWPLPMFDSPNIPSMVPVDIDGAKVWAAKVEAMDGYIVVTPEYNHSIPAVLKNALDHAYAPWNRKPMAFVGYGSVGAARSIEQARMAAIELQMTPTREAVHIGREPMVAMMFEGKTLADYNYLVQQAERMLDDLAWWAATLKAGREALAALSQAA